MAETKQTSVFYEYTGDRPVWSKTLKRDVRPGETVEVPSGVEEDFKQKFGKLVNKVTKKSE